MVRGEKSRDDFALQLGVHKNTIARWERGEQFPDAQEIALILEAYPDINPAWFVTGKGIIKLHGVVSGEKHPESTAKEPGIVWTTNYDAELEEILSILQHDLPEAKKFVLQVLKGRKEVKKGMEGLGMKLGEDLNK